MAKSRDQIWDEWQDGVNMAPHELEDWLETDESKAVGDADDAEIDRTPFGPPDRRHQAHQ